MIRMAHHWLLAAVIFAAPLPCAAAVIEGSGHAATADRPATGFHALSVSVPSRVDVAQGDAEGLTIEADDNVLPRIESRVEDGVLRIRFPEGLAVRPRAPIRIAVRLRSIDAATLAGDVRLEAPALEVDRLRMRLSGASSARLAKVAAHGIELETTGHCHAMAAGTTQDFELRLSGAGEINAARLEARHARVKIAGSGEVAVWARESLEARITGSGAVRYFGDPVVGKRVVGTGAVERLGAAPP